jgi:hypothetical protein
MRSHWVSWALLLLLGFGVVWSRGMIRVIAQERGNQQIIDSNRLVWK